MPRFLAVFVCLVAAVECGAQGVMTTVAGSQWIFPGNRMRATDAPLGSSRGLALDAGGNVYISDQDNDAVFRMSPDGTLTRVAGNAIFGYSGDGGPATDASLAFPGNIALDRSGNLYIADVASLHIRKVTPDGRISTFAGIGRMGYSGDGGPALNAQFSDFFGLTVDPDGMVYVADRRNHRIRRIDASGIITTVAGTGIAGFGGDGGAATSAQLNEPTGVAVDSRGNIYVADSANNRIRRFVLGGTITTIAGTAVRGFSGDGGPASEARLSRPYHVALDPAGNLYIADSTNQRIRRIGTDGVIRTIAGNGVRSFGGDGGPAISASLQQPETVAADSAGNVYIGDTINERIRKVTPAGTITTIAGNGRYRFGGDSGPATSASLKNPYAVAADAAGNLYVADTFNLRVRKVAPNGIITTIAGDGVPRFAGDGGPATLASLDAVYAVAVNSAGIVLIGDTLNARVRQIGPDGIIRTVAGGGQSSPGDGGPATSARLASIYAVTTDAAGNFYLADSSGHRVRKVTPAGVINTIAGNGTAGFSGDSGPATQASLNSPQGIAVDRTGNVYIADKVNQRVRKVTPGGIISTVAGNGTKDVGDDGLTATSTPLWDPVSVAVDSAGSLYIGEGVRVRKLMPDGTLSTVAGTKIQGFSGDGGPATGANLAFPTTGLAFDASDNLYISDAANDRIRKVLSTAPAFNVSPDVLRFTTTAGAAAVAGQQLSITSSVTGLIWASLVSTESGGDWLTVAPNTGPMPAGVSVSVNAAGLAAGTYRGIVNIHSPLATPAARTVVVELTIQPGTGEQLLVEPASVLFEAGASTPASVSLRIAAASGESLEWVAAVETDTGNWLTVSPSAGTAGRSGSSVPVSVNASSLTPGVYSGAVVITARAGALRQRVPVTLLLSQVTQTILVSQTGLLFTAVEGAGSAPSQSIGILNTGQGTMNWTARAETASGGSWLSVAPASGSSAANSLQIPLVQINVNTTGLRAGQYSGLVRIESSGATNSPQLVTVELNVLPAGSNPGVTVRPTGLIFAAPTGSASPSSQTIDLTTPVASTIEARGGLLTFDGGNWLEALPRNPVISGSSPGTVTIQPNAEGLAPGIYRAALTLIFADGSPSQVVNVLFVVTSGTATAGAKPGHGGAAITADCTPQRLFAQPRSLGSNFSSPVGWPATVEVQVIDDCGSPVSDASVVSSFSNGDPSMTLANLRTGVYVGTWRPATPAPQVVVTMRATRAGREAAEVQARGSVPANQTAALLFAGGIVNGASFASGAPLAPGSIVSVFGRNLARGVASSTTLPLATTLAGMSLTIGGRSAPLFFSSDGQVNAQIPTELPANSRPQVVARLQRETGGEALTVPETITLSAAQPACFTQNQQGTGQGSILDVRGRIVDSNAPAAVGEVIQVFCTGLGATNPPVASGRAAPSAEPLARVTAPVQARIGDQPATVHFAGLAPGFVGLYQVNVEIPAGVSPGPAVPLVLTQAGSVSNTVTLAIR